MPEVHETRLLPVDRWEFHLWRASFSEREGAAPRAVHYLVSTDTHVCSEVWVDAPSWAEFAAWEIVKENVGRPRQVGSLYGSRLDESAVVAGQRVADELGLL